jgi:hypothetical protein
MVLQMVSDGCFRAWHTGDLLLLSKDRRQTTNLGTQSRPNVLGLIRDKVLHASHDLIKQGVAVDQGAEA